MLREDADDDKRLVAYVVVRSVADSKLFPALREFLLQKLPTYMLPSDFVVMDRIPLTPNGKVDRLALPPPKRVRQELDSTFVAPTTPTEIALAEIWKELLRIDRVGLNDNFFELGGDSIMLVRVHEHLRSRLSSDLPIAHLFAFPTIHTLGQRLDNPEKFAGFDPAVTNKGCILEHGRAKQ